jgi:hypothetical protein
MEDQAWEPAPNEKRVPQGDVVERRSLPDLYLAGGATGAGLATGKLLVDATGAKIKGALAKPKDEGSKIVLPPRSNDT